MAEKTKIGDPINDHEMTFLDHLEELRWRLVRASIAIFLFAIVAFVGKKVIFDWILFAPRTSDFITYRAFCSFSNLLGLGDKLCLGGIDITLQNINMSGQFSMHIMVSMVAGLIIAFPYVIYQFWAFIKPGLKEKEIKNATGTVFYCSLLFFLGIVFGYFVIAPLSVQFLGTYSVSDTVNNQVQLNSYISTLVSITLMNGLVFELPIFIFFFTKIGLVTPEFLRKYRKHALVVVLILAAIITPPDVITQVLVALPLLLLYEISIQISSRVMKKQREMETA